MVNKEYGHKTEFKLKFFYIFPQEPCETAILQSFLHKKLAIPKVVLQNAAIRLFWGNMEKEMKLCFKSFGDQYAKKYDFLSRTSKIGIFGANRAYNS